MARRYHQSRSDRMDESLGSRRGKESSKKQSMKSRRDESMGMKGEHYEDHPSQHMGHGDFANMPPREIMHEYPKEKYGYGAMDDTIYGIDEVDTESYKKTDGYRSRQK